MSSGYQQAREGAAFDERTDRGRLLLSGSDVKTFLHALLTNDIASLAPGSGCYAALLTPQGRMITDMEVLTPAVDAALLVVPSDVAATLAGRLDTSIFTEDVAVADTSGSTVQFSITGPGAAVALDKALVSLGYDPISSRLAAPFANEGVSPPDARAIAWRSDTFESIGIPEFNIAVPRDRADHWRAEFGREAIALTPHEREVLRVEAGRPEFLVDMTAETIPLEANLLDRAISTSKGCYVGQEVIIRVLHRGGGRVAKRLVSLRFDSRESRVPARGATMSVEGKDAGRVTSAVWSPHAGHAIGLGYVHRDYVREGLELAVDDGARATITRV